MPIRPVRCRIRIAIWLVLLMAMAGRAKEFGQPQAVPGAKQAATTEQRATRQFDRIRRDPPALRAFLRAMPKGADLHTHLTGAVYAESYIRWAAERPLCIDVSTFVFVDAQSSASGPPASQVTTCTNPTRQRPASNALQDPVLYRSLVDALSTRHWNSARTPGHYQFFDAFVKLGAAFARFETGQAARN
jgi:adenosine deaminase